MKTKLNFLPYLIIFSTLILSASCKKEGCTDKNATNYSADADKDDGSCNYPVNNTENNTEENNSNNNNITEEFTATIDGSSFGATTYSVSEMNGKYAISGSNTSINSGINLQLSTTSSSGSLGMISASYVDNGNNEAANSGSYSYTVENNVISGTFSFETSSHSITNGEFTIEL